MAHIEVHDLSTVGQGAAAFLIGQPRITGERTENRFCIRSTAVIERTEPHAPYHLYIGKGVADYCHMNVVHTALIHVECDAALHAGQSCRNRCAVVLHTYFSQIDVFRVQRHRFPVEAEAIGKVHIRRGTLKPCNRIPRDRAAFFIA